MIEIIIIIISTLTLSVLAWQFVLYLSDRKHAQRDREKAQEDRGLAQKDREQAQRDRERSERRPFDDEVEKIMQQLREYILKLQVVEKNTGFQPEKIDTDAVSYIRAIKNNASLHYWPQTIAALSDKHPSQALSISLSAAYEAHNHMALQMPADFKMPSPEITEALQQKLAPAAKAAYEAYKDLYRISFRERKIINPNLKPPESPSMQKILEGKNS